MRLQHFEEAILHATNAYYRIATIFLKMTTLHECFFMNRHNKANIGVLGCSLLSYEQVTLRSKNCDYRVEMGVCLGSRNQIYYIYFVYSGMLGLTKHGASDEYIISLPARQTETYTLRKNIPSINQKASRFYHSAQCHRS